MRANDGPLLVVADLHGHLDLFERLLERLDALYPNARLATLGDYVDNGPQIPALLERPITLHAERPGRFFPILGNHDLALLCPGLARRDVRPGLARPLAAALLECGRRDPACLRGKRSTALRPGLSGAPPTVSGGASLVLRRRRPCVRPCRACLHDRAWDRVVVSVHTRLAGLNVFSAPQRVYVSATADRGGGVGRGLAQAALLAQRRGRGGRGAARS